LPPNPALQLTAFGARDRGFLNVILCHAPWPQLNANPLGGSPIAPMPVSSKSASQPLPSHCAGIIRNTGNAPGVLSYSSAGMTATELNNGQGQLRLWLRAARLTRRKDDVMQTNDPRYPDGWDALDTSLLVSAPALQLLAHIHHHLRQKVAITAGLGQLLADGVFGFASSEQQAAIGQLRTHIAAIEQAQQ
jgi:hypothetical protein